MQYSAGVIITECSATPHTDNMRSADSIQQLEYCTQKTQSHQLSTHKTIACKTGRAWLMPSTTGSARSNHGVTSNLQHSYWHEEASPSAITGTDGHCTRSHAKMQ